MNKSCASFLCQVVTNTHTMTVHSRYDPSGLGDSQGLKLTETSFSLWLEDAKEILSKVAEGPQIVICSSMGCWVSVVVVYDFVVN